MTYIGVLQTPDIDEAIAVAEEHMAKGRHIMAKCVVFMREEDELRLMEQDPEGYVLAMNEHWPIEYEIHVDFNDWMTCQRVGCPVIIDDLKDDKYPGLCGRCQYYEPKEG